jgi:hypothetical protein
MVGPSTIAGLSALATDVVAKTDKIMSIAIKNVNIFFVVFIV